jgi:hypothetical protein
MKSTFQIGKVAKREEFWNWRPDMMHHGIARNVKDIAMIASVFAAGESLTLYIITSQSSLSVREQLKKHGVRFGTDLIMKLNAKPYINADIFFDYVQTVFLSNLAELRRLDTFAEEMAVLLMDNCPSHITRDVM